MFTGIIETMGFVEAVRMENSNLEIDVSAAFDEELKVNQSIAHNGVCLSVTEIKKKEGERVFYSVTAVRETLSKTNLGDLRPGSLVNLERALRADARLEGHFVLGHADATGEILSVEEVPGSHLLLVRYPAEFSSLVIGRGSISMNGVSLTVAGESGNTFSVAIIPLTWERTNLHLLKPGEFVNLEFDVLGKYARK